MIVRALFLVGFAATALAAQPHHSADTPLLSYLQVGSHRIAFESDTLVERGVRVALIQSTFADVRRALGPAAVSTSGDAGDALSWVCYRLAGAPRMSLILKSDEMGGMKWITTFDLVRAGSYPVLERRCASLDTPSSAVVSNTGLRLGLSRREVETRLGVAGRDSADVVIYDRSRDLTMRGRDGKQIEYTQTSGYVVHFVRGHVAAFSGYRLDAS